MNLKLFETFTDSMNRKLFENVSLSYVVEIFGESTGLRMFVFVMSYISFTKNFYCKIQNKPKFGKKLEERKTTSRM